jgi:hypothetical protein
VSIGTGSPKATGSHPHSWNDVVRQKWGPKKPSWNFEMQLESILYSAELFLSCWELVFCFCCVLFKRHMKPDSLKVASIFMLSKAPQCKSRIQEHYTKFGLWHNSRIKQFILIMPLRLATWALTLHFYLISKTGKFYHIGKVFFFLTFTQTETLQ